MTRRHASTSSAPATRFPAYTAGRGEGDNLYTCSLVAVNVDTGKMAWSFQTSPHDMHDWDSAQTPVLFDGVVKGKPRKLVSTAARNGYFFTVDRVTGEHIVTTGTVRTTNWVRAWTRTDTAPSYPVKDPTIPAPSRHRPPAAPSTGSHRPIRRTQAVLRDRAQQLLDLLPHRSRSAGLDGPRRQGGGRGGLDGQLPHGDRSDDGQDRLAAAVPRLARRWRRRRRGWRPADDGRQARLRGRCRRQPRRV